MSGQRIVEGIFAINKPTRKTSAQVLRDLQQAFNKSALFAPWLAEQRARRERENKTQQRRRRKHARLEVKLGHGGTLDPMATGVLIVGVGRGTKSLQDFLACTKTYETTALFGAMSDTYDVTGRILARAPPPADGEDGVTREKVEEAIVQRFTGQIMQRPPMYSALRVQGKRLYEYAREGKEPPVDVQERPVRVDDIRVVQWFEPGTHGFSLPADEAEPEEKEVAAKLENVDIQPREDAAKDGQAEDSMAGAKRKRSNELETVQTQAEGEEAEPPLKKVATEDTSADQKDNEVATNVVADESNAQPSTEAQGSTATNADAPATEGSTGENIPAAKISVTSSSGFYVRSLCHDLGKAVGSLGLMASLVRTRQAQFELGKNVLEYEDIEKGEAEWGPKIDAMLTQWADEHYQTER